MSRAWPLTVYFASLVVFALLAGVAATVYVFVQTDRDSRHTAEQNAAFAARAAARELGDGVATVKASVAGLAATPGIDAAAGQPSCTLSFSVGSLNRGHIDILRPDGSVACSSRKARANGQHRSYAGSPWLAEGSKGAVLEAPVADTVTGDPSVVSTAPTPGHGYVATFVALEPVAASFVEQYGGDRPVEVLLTSADGKTVLARSTNPKRWIGKSLADTDFARAGDSVERQDLDGKTRLYAQATVPGVGWKLFVGEDKAAALAAGHRLRERQLLIIVAGLLLVVLATAFVYRRVAVPIRRLGSEVRATAAVTPPQPVHAAGPAEVENLGRDVNTLIGAVGDELGRREEAEESTRASERSYRRLFESSPLPMWIEDADTEDVLAVNDAAVARYGYTREEFLALRKTDIVADGQRVRDDSDSMLPRVSQHRRKDGSELKVRTIAHPVSFQGRPASGVIAEDVGERERLEGQLRQAQKMEAVGQLAGGVSHDFNNLLTVMAGYGEMARTRIGAGPGAQELHEIERAVERAAQLTRQLLAFSRQQVLEPTVLDLNEVVAAIVPMLKRLIGEDVQIGVLSGRETPTVLADRGQIEQVIVNLAVNGRDAMPGGGMLTIETRNVMLDEHYTAAHAGVEPGSYACLSVTDTGTGIDQETQSRIFDPFFTTKALCTPGIRQRRGLTAARRSAAARRRRAAASATRPRCSASARS